MLQKTKPKKDWVKLELQIYIINTKKWGLLVKEPNL